PADRFGLGPRGRILVGAPADLVAVSALEEGASYRNPRVYPRGIEWVIVAGEVALEAGEPVGARAGQILRGS
ncbi:MAG: D-aminoacylase, partial [Planctomycetes bacterium]|nr:D-aminoacylase [Planctomycetota bacterium]